MNYFIQSLQTPMLDTIIICIAYIRKLKLRGETFFPRSLNLSVAEPGMNDIEGKVSFPCALLHNGWSESVIDDAISYSTAIFHPHRCLISPRDHSLYIMESQRHTLGLGCIWCSEPASVSSNQKTSLWRQTSSNQVCLSISLWTKNDIYYPIKNKSSCGYNL